MKFLISDEDYSVEMVIKNKTIVERYKDNPDKARDYLLGIFKEAIGFLVTPEELQGVFLEMEKETIKKKLKLLKVQLERRTQ